MSKNLGYEELSENQKLIMLQYLVEEQNMLILLAYKAEKIYAADKSDYDAFLQWEACDKAAQNAVAEVMRYEGWKG